MVVDNLNVNSVLVYPFETNSALIVDTNAKLTFPISLERFESITPEFS